MRNVNRVILAGNLTRDPEFRRLPSDTAVANFGMALNRRWRNRDGQVQEETTFVDCETYGRQAEVLHQYARKGRGLFIEGRLKLDQWQDREGHNRSKLKVVVENFQFTDSPAGGQDQSSAAGQASRQAGGEAAQTDRPASRSAGNPRDVNDLLPF